MAKGPDSQVEQERVIAIQIITLLDREYWDRVNHNHDEPIKRIVAPYEMPATLCHIVGLLHSSDWFATSTQGAQDVKLTYGHGIATFVSRGMHFTLESNDFLLEIRPGANNPAAIEEASIGPGRDNPAREIGKGVCQMLLANQALQARMIAACGSLLLGHDDQKYLSQFGYTPENLSKT